MTEETKKRGYSGILALILAGAAIATAYFYFQTPKATITVYSDGSVDATLGNQKITDKNWVLNGVLELKTWNGYLLQIFIPTLISRKSEVLSITNGSIGYQLSKSGNILSSGTNIVDNQSDNYITITFA